MTDKTPIENKSEKAQTVVYKYDGNGDYFHGVPPRDLTKDDFDALTDEQKESVTKGALYKKGAR
jgi:hypothetical protein